MYRIIASQRISISVLALVALGCLARLAWGANGAHFQRGRASLDSSGDYCVQFREVGLGDTPVDYRLDATATFTYQCFTKQGNQPHGEPNSGGPSDASTSTTVTPHNGHIAATICLQPTPGDTSCQGQGLKLCLTAVDYQEVSLTDDTNGVTLDPSATPDLSASGLRVCP